MKRYLVVALMSAPVLFGQPIEIKGLDGLKAKASDVVDVSLNKDMLKAGAGFLGSGKVDDAAKIRKLIEGGMESIVVKSFEFEKDGVYTQTELDEIARQMSQPGWNLIVTTTEKKSGESTRVWARTGTPQASGGVRVLSAEPKELTIIEAIGKFNLSDLQDLAGLTGIRDVTIEHSGKKKED
jgi:hypothetical protein